MSNQDALNQWSDVFMNTYGTPQLHLVKGEGATVTDADGNEYVDMLAGIAVNSLGHAHPALVSAVATQAGTLGHISNFTTRYFGMSSGGFFCRFPMPYRKGFRMEVENLDKTIDTEVFCNVLYQEQQVAEDAAYFHAQYHSGPNPGPEPTRIMEAEGRGHFVGCVVSMQGENRGYMSYLEAPEYIYVDEDWEKPRIVGTGLEDYFMGGWYFREGEFTGEMHGVPFKDALDASIAMYRIHEDDAIHFKKRMKFDFVNPWAPERLQPFMYSSAAFFYLDSPDGQQPPLPTGDALLPWYRTKNTDRQSIP